MLIVVGCLQPNTFLANVKTNPSSRQVLNVESTTIAVFWVALLPSNLTFVSSTVAKCPPKLTAQTTGPFSTIGLTDSTS